MIEPTKAPMAATTMVGGDHFFLERWVNYYGKHLGRENLYIYSHGGDPAHKEIAAGANVIYLPYDDTRFSWNQRRWQMISLFNGAFSNFYNWVLSGDVDEIVAVDPAVSDNLVDYIAGLPRNRLPRVLTPFAFEMVHNPTLEPDPIEPGVNLLERRRIFRLNANYCKPCIVRAPVSFAPGGHYANHNRVHLDENLYLFHLRFIDYNMTKDRLALRREQRNIASGDLKEVKRKATGWDTAWDDYQIYAKREPVAETASFPEVRAKMLEGWKVKKGSYWSLSGGRSKEVYRLPERFSELF
ncbi:glycosyltransferase family 2 protein [Pseudaestuariivita rosea]|uniref:glycosyltransferase family 2 protein n=1 Tax=Pseudaestuariivita rosea TaxID=2763263 RepID=UPI001ABAD907|nr:glycosyltransferase family 2 protein [Pseudaestuariivita rosea]